jgi:predicted DCC family thiol-disulfide oxidoreductase YuxK
LYVLVYDSYCGPCTRFRNAVDFLDTKGRINFVGLAQADKDNLLDSIPAARRHRSFHLISPDGTVASGAAALPPLVGLLPAGRTFERVMELSLPVTLATKFIYSTFSRLHDSGSCTYSPTPVSTSISMSRKKIDDLYHAISGLQAPTK